MSESSSFTNPAGEGLVRLYFLDTGGNIGVIVALFNY